jgi:hypothetical protein
VYKPPKKLYYFVNTKVTFHIYLYFNPILFMFEEFLEWFFLIFPLLFIILVFCYFCCIRSSPEAEVQESLNRYCIPQLFYMEFFNKIEKYTFGPPSTVHFYLLALRFLWYLHLRNGSKCMHKILLSVAPGGYFSLVIFVQVSHCVEIIFYPLHFYMCVVRDSPCPGPSACEAGPREMDTLGPVPEYLILQYS